MEYGSELFQGMLLALSRTGNWTKDNIHKLLEGETTDKLIHQAVAISEEDFRNLLLKMLSDNIFENEEKVKNGKPQARGFFDTSLAQRASETMRQETPKQEARGAWSKVPMRERREKKSVSFVSPGKRQPVSVWEVAEIGSAVANARADQDNMAFPPKDPIPGHIFYGWTEVSDGWQRPNFVKREEVLHFPFEVRVGENRKEWRKEKGITGYEYLTFREAQKQILSYAIESKKRLSALRQKTQGHYGGRK